MSTGTGIDKRWGGGGGDGQAGWLAGCCGALVLGVAHTVGIDGKHGLRLGQAGRVVNFANARLAAALAEVEPGCGCIRAGRREVSEGGGSVREKEV